MQFVKCLFAALLVALVASFGSAQPEWRDMYRDGTWDADVSTWIGDGTRSELTGDGLLIADESAANGSGRLYMLDWCADAGEGAAFEARLKSVALDDVWGTCMHVADGVHEEALGIFPDRLVLAFSKLEVPFDAAGDFHTYRVETKGEDIKVFADEELVIDGTGKFTKDAHANRNRCAFGSGSSAAKGEAVWAWVRYRSAKPASNEKAPAESWEFDGLTVTRGETIQLIPNAIYRSLFKFSDGGLAVSDRRSQDNGRTWQDKFPSLHVGAIELDDGEVIQLGFKSKKVNDGVFSIELSRSTDGGKTFAEETATLNIPEATGGTGDDGSAFEGPVADHAIVQCKDGSLLAAMYGYFKTDTVLCPSFPAEWKTYKYRTFVVRSTDRGKTWDYWATVAYNPDIGLESFCEADLLTLPGGDILCFMRTGGSQGARKFTPLYLSVSKDGGKTWGEPKPIADRGVWPNACRMADGTIAVTYGRPGNWLAFSMDDGETWTGHLMYYEGQTTSYNSVEEVGPGTLLVVYDMHSLASDGNVGKGVAATFFAVSTP